MYLFIYLFMYQVYSHDCQEGKAHSVDANRGRAIHKLRVKASQRVASFTIFHYVNLKFSYSTSFGHDTENSHCSFAQSVLHHENHETLVDKKYHFLREQSVGSANLPQYQNSNLFKIPKPPITTSGNG